jgi:hypothetical protein
VRKWTADVYSGESDGVVTDGLRGTARLVFSRAWFNSSPSSFSKWDD